MNDLILIKSIHALVCFGICLVFGLRVYDGLRTGVINGNGFGPFNRLSSPLLFWAYAAMYAVGAGLAAVWFAHSSFEVLQHIPGALPTGDDVAAAARALTSPTRNP